MPTKARWEDKQPARSAEAARAGIQLVKPALRCDRENPCLRPEKKTLCFHSAVVVMRAFVLRGDL
jgi:hypothetical protein